VAPQMPLEKLLLSSRSSAVHYKKQLWRKAKAEDTRKQDQGRKKEKYNPQKTYLSEPVHPGR
jgi:hypothetical protein